MLSQCMVETVPYTNNITNRKFKCMFNELLLSDDLHWNTQKNTNKGLNI